MIEPRLVLAALALAACGSTAAPPAPSCPPCDCATTEATATPAPDPDPDPDPDPEPDPEPDGTVRVAVGACDVRSLPPGLVEDLSDDDTAALAELVRQWLAGDPSGPRVDAAMGIRHAKSEDDSGADPPYPSWTRAQSSLVCGAPARWLASNVRESFALHAALDQDGVRCQDNVCCHDGMEFVSNGYVVFRRNATDGEPEVVLHAVGEVAEAALGEEYATRNREYVARELGRLERRRCPGEPSGRP